MEELLTAILKELKEINNKLDDIKSDTSWIEGYTESIETEMSSMNSTLNDISNSME